VVVELFNLRDVCWYTYYIIQLATMTEIGGVNLPPEIMAKLAELDLELSEGL